MHIIVNSLGFAAWFRPEGLLQVGLHGEATLFQLAIIYENWWSRTKSLCDNYGVVGGPMTVVQVIRAESWMKNVSPD